MPANLSATSALREEHQLILKVLGAFERLIAGLRGQIGDPVPPDLTAMSDFLTFFHLFTDTCHRKQEEDILFDELVDRGMPREVGPIAVMLSEHVQGKLLVRAMNDALKSAKDGEPEGWAVLEKAARDYIALLRGHIMKEDGALFQMADEMISGPACLAVCDRYHEACLARFEGRTKIELEELAASLIERFPPTSA